MIDALIETLPEDWIVSTLGEVCRAGGGDIQTGPFGSQLHKSDYVPAGIPSIMPQNIGDNRIIEDGIARIKPSDADRLSRYRVRAGDIVYSRRGDIEKRALIREPESGWLCGTGCLRVRLGEKGPDPRYASFYLAHPSVREWIVRHAHGATMPNLNTSILGGCPFILPSLEDQTRIVEVLGALDDKIELNRQTNETLEALARALFKDWFVDFGPTRTKTEGGAPYLAPELWALFPDALDDEDKPVGWNNAEIGDICRIKSGKRPPKKAEIPGLENRYPVYGGNGISWYTNDTLYDPPFVITGRVGTLGTAFRVFEQFWVSDNALCFFPKVTDYFSLIYFLITQLDFKSLNSASTQPLLTQTAVKSQQIILGSPQVLKAFAENVDRLFQKIEQNKVQNETLAQTRNLLLPKLMSGEIRLREAEREVEAVL